MPKPAAKYLVINWSKDPYNRPYVSMVNGNLIENRPALHDYLNNAASDSWRVVGMSDQTILLEKQPEE